MKAFYSILLLGLLHLTAVSAKPLFGEKNVRCYNFKSLETPEASQEAQNVETWCYHQEKSHDPLFIFNADQEISVATSLLVEEDGTITHGSLSAGKITYHRVQGNEYNPFSIPLLEPKDTPVSEVRISNLQAEQTLNSLANHREKTFSNFGLQSGHFSSFVQAHRLPWRGSWWSYKMRFLHKDDKAPLAKYDRFAQARTRLPSGARAWESHNHKYKGVWWEGHCNGWAASSILRAEPRVSRKDPLSGTVFQYWDQKGILAETDYCALASFFGSRNRGRSTDNKKDIYPDVFHKTILYYIGNLGKPVVIDYRSDPAVDNHPVSGYTMDIVQKSPTSFEVTAVLNFHKYDNKKSYPPGLAPLYTRTYKYTLNQNLEGKITGGFWRSENPDFIWVPLASLDCNRNNPFINHAFVNEILHLPVVAGENLDLF